MTLLSRFRPPTAGLFAFPKLWLVAAIAVLSACHQKESAPVTSNFQEAAASLEELTSRAPVKLAWLDGDRLMGFDTLAPARPVELRQGPELERPLFAPDGSILLFTEAGKIQAMTWPGQDFRALREGFAVAVLRDESGKDWVYAAESAEGKKLLRFPLREPEAVEPVWEAAPVDPRTVQLSRDGKWMSAAFYQQDTGWADVAAGRWNAFTGRRPFSMVADASRLAVMLDGTGRWLRFFNTMAEPWHPNAEDLDVPGGWRFPLPVSAPTDGVTFSGLRWSNHARFPLLFNDSHLALLRLTPDGRGGDKTAALGVSGEAIRAADAWIGGGEASSLEGWAASPPSQPLPDRTGDKNWDRWPFTYEGVAFAWRDSRTPVVLPGRDEPCRLTPHQWGRYKESCALWINDSTYQADTISARALAEGVRASGTLGVELQLHEAIDEESPLSIRLAALILKDGREAFSLSRVNTTLVMRVLMDEGDATKAREYQDVLQPVGLDPSVPMHLAISVENGKITWVIDGSYILVNPREMGPGKMTAWDPENVAELVIGDTEPKNEARWRGFMKHILFSSQPISSGQVKAHRANSRTRATEWLLGPSTRLRVKLIEAATLPPEGTHGGRFLVQQMYRVESVISGKIPVEIMPIWHWGRMDGVDVPSRPTEVGKTYELLINQAARHPELELETVLLGPSGQLEPAYFDLASPGSRARLAEDTPSSPDPEQ